MSTTCTCASRPDGSIRRCRPHRLAHEIADLGEAYLAAVSLIPVTDQRRSSRGAGGSHAAGLNLTALELTSGWYTESLSPDPDNPDAVDTEPAVLPGVVPTVLGAGGRWMGLEPATRRALGESARRLPRQPGWDGLGADPRVRWALRWLGAQVPRLCGDDRYETHVDWLLEELHRIRSRLRGLLEGDHPAWEPCPDCGVVSALFPAGSLVVRPERTSVQERGGRKVVVREPAEAACCNPSCAEDQGEPRCWRWDPDGVGEGWVRVARPTVTWLGRPLPPLEAGTVMSLIAEAAALGTGTGAA